MKTIESAKYEGYLWYSDKGAPQVFSGDVMSGEIVLADNDNPFVVEGNLWNAESLESITIRYVDGQYWVRRTTVGIDELLGVEATVDKPVATSLKKYVPHRIEGVKYLKFLQYWHGAPDPMCCGMKALRPEKLVFVGFEKQ